MKHAGFSCWTETATDMAGLIQAVLWCYFHRNHRREKRSRLDEFRKKEGGRKCLIATLKDKERKEKLY